MIPSHREGRGSLAGFSDLVAELKRRRVFRALLGWGVAAFAALQVYEPVMHGLHLPEWTLSFVVVALGLGFPITAALAWVFDLKASGIERTPPAGNGDPPAAMSRGSRRARLALLLLGLGGAAAAPGLVYFFAWPGAGRPPAQGSAGPSAAADPSIAVLPLVNLSSDKEQEYFSDGLTEELLNLLAKVPGLRVASRTSAFAFKGKNVKMSEIGRELGVATVLEGSVRKSGDQVRITTQLISAADGYHLWSETYDRELTDIFAIQDEIANAIVNALRAQLGAAGRAAAVKVRVDTENVEAYEIYLKARELFIARSDLTESIRLFEQVTRMDPSFARGWEGLAAVCSVAPSWNITDRDYYAIATQAAERALKLDPTLSMPWAALANVGQDRLPVDWAANLDMLGRAIDGDPRNSTAYLWRSIAWINLGFFDRAIADQDRCLKLDPQYHNCTRWKAVALLYLGRTDPALALFEEGVAAGFLGSRESSFVPLLLRRGDRVGATLLLQQLVDNRQLASILLKAAQHPGPLEPAEVAMLDRAIADRDSKYNANIGATTTYQWLGEYDRIATAVDFSTSYTAQWEPGFPGFVNSRGFKAVLEKLGVPKYWREHGHPPQCRPAGAQGYTCS
jgi:TolB-like protein